MKSPIHTAARAEPARLLSTRMVAERYGNVTVRTIERWTLDEEMKFPAPIRVGRRKFWREIDLAAFEREKVRALGDEKVRAA